MDYRIRRFGIASTALTVAIIYFVLGLVIAPLIYMVSLIRLPGHVRTISTRFRLRVYRNRLLALQHCRLELAWRWSRERLVG